MRRLISLGMLVLVFGASPLPLALGHQGSDPEGPYFDLHDLVAGMLSEGTCLVAHDLERRVVPAVEPRRRAGARSVFI